MPTPTVLLIPGFWEGPTVYTHLATLLTTAGYPVETATLPSTGTVSPGNPTMKDDIAALRAAISRMVSRGDSVVLVLHSAGGFLGCEAMQGLDRGARGGEGGVVGIVFLAAAVFPVGLEHKPLPFAWVEGGASYCANPQKLLFGDLSEEEQRRWTGVLRPQPAQGWDATVEYAGWRDVPSVYLVCEADQALPVGLQEQLAATAGSRVERCSAGHVPQVGQPERVAEVVLGAVAEFTES
ncbi:alpha/beta hydrolase [Aspergillus fijiensis CBS 313.89]|uniref:Alpha/beta-hydrolase n=1 Tax=Aspergillus fijiensis CBS 313.89 TaxID=1448319 RepID=A0A8G1RJL5_9EURO|nr:alpha/beta-hydrolase [Aspergillus fijiensis CBS 313.89]RAK73343.1 alpha/beta-hydrolase [Aspergillus fijiensis CBS 313.89]